MHGEIDSVRRNLSSKEREFLFRMLESGKPEAYRFIPQIDDAQVVGECQCGCESIYFVEPNNASRLILAQHWTDGRNGGRTGIIVFAIDEQLAGLEFIDVNWNIKEEQPLALSVFQSLDEDAT